MRFEPVVVQAPASTEEDSPAPVPNSNLLGAGNVTPFGFTAAPNCGLMSDGIPPRLPTPSAPSAKRVIEAVWPKPSFTEARPSFRAPVTAWTAMRETPPRNGLNGVFGRMSQVGATQRIDDFV